MKEPTLESYFVLYESVDRAKRARELARECEKQKHDAADTGRRFSYWVGENVARGGDEVEVETWILLIEANSNASAKLLQEIEGSCKKIASEFVAKDIMDALEPFDESEVFDKDAVASASCQTKLAVEEMISIRDRGQSLLGRLRKSVEGVTGSVAP